MKNCYTDIYFSINVKVGSTHLEDTSCWIRLEIEADTGDQLFAVSHAIDGLDVGRVGEVQRDGHAACEASRYTSLHLKAVRSCGETTSTPSVISHTF